MAIDPGVVGPQDLELKRPLWVIGASDYNLGAAVAYNATMIGNYKSGWIIQTDEASCDVCAPDSLDSKLDEIIALSPETGVDVVYAAGLNLLNPCRDTEETDLFDTFNVNVMGFIRLMRAIARRFPRQEHSIYRQLENQSRVNVVAVASDAARVAMRNSITYCASKAALVQAVRVAARELAPYVRVNAVSPAIIEGTPMTTAIDAEVRLQRNWTEEQARSYEKSLIPMGRRAEKYEVSKVILQALEGPVFMTGSNIEITGGK